MTSKKENDSSQEKTNKKTLQQKLQEVLINIQDLRGERVHTTTHKHGFERETVLKILS